jgi:hypothetical protein
MYMSKPSNAKFRISKPTLALMEKVNKLLSNYYSAFYQYDDKKLVEISEERYKIPEVAYNLMENSKYTEIQVIQLLLEVFRKMLDSLDDYVGMQY